MLRPQDLVLALHLSGHNSADTTPPQRESAELLGVSQAEISNGVRRLQASLLALEGSTTIIIPNLIEFCSYGVRYAFSAKIGAPKKGVPTASLAEPLRAKCSEEEGAFVWPCSHGILRAPTLQPLHPSVLVAVDNSQRMYRLLTLLDGIRVGRRRMRETAMDLLSAEVFLK